MAETELANLIEMFLGGNCGDWNDFISVRQKDNELEKFRLRCAAVAITHPLTKPHTNCSEEGVKELRILADKLRREAANN